MDILKIVPLLTKLTKSLLPRLAIVWMAFFPGLIKNWALAQYETCTGTVVEIESPSIRTGFKASEISKQLNRVDLICPSAAVSGPVNIMDCYAAHGELTFNVAFWEMRQYESVKLLVPTAILGFL